MSTASGPVRETLEDHPWVTGFISVETVLLVIAILLYVMTESTDATNPAQWSPLRVTGLLIAAFSIIVGAFGLVLGIVYVALQIHNGLSAP
jgi:heme/copper-type cytochrome/quinol oxidase subunit 2